MRGIERHGGAAPIAFARLLPLVNDRAAVLEAIDILLERKHDAPEMGLAPRVELLDAFIEDDLARIEATSPQSAPHAQAPVAVDTLFHETVDEVVRSGDAV